MYNDLSFVEFTIRRWFNDYRPDLRSEVNGEMIEKLISQIEPDIKDLEPTAKKIHIHGFLRLNYPIELTEMVKEVLEEQKGKYAETIQDWKNFAVYHYEVGNIIEEMAEKKITEKYLTYDNGEMVYDAELKKEIEKIAQEKIEREW